MGGEGFLLSAQPPDLLGRKTLVLDLDETLVHSSFKVKSRFSLQFFIDI